MCLYIALVALVGVVDIANMTDAKKVSMASIQGDVAAIKWNKFNNKNPLARLPVEESDVQACRRLKQELRRLPHKPITAIPYEYIGADITSLYAPDVPAADRVNYPDWFRLTPAFKIQNAGMSPAKHVRSLFNPVSNNNAVRRFGRWSREKITVVYCNWMDKLAGMITVLLVLLSVSLLVWQFKAKAKPVFVYKGTDPTEEDKHNIDTLNKYGIIWDITRIVLSSIAVMITAWNVYKRTTLPMSNTMIEDPFNGRETGDSNVSVVVPTANDHPHKLRLREKSKSQLHFDDVAEHPAEEELAQEELAEELASSRQAKEVHFLQRSHAFNEHEHRPANASFTPIQQFMQ